MLAAWSACTHPLLRPPTCPPRTMAAGKAIVDAQGQAHFGKMLPLFESYLEKKAVQVRLDCNGLQLMQF